MWSVRVAYTLEQCWHRVPGGTGVAALRIAEAMRSTTSSWSVWPAATASRHRRRGRRTIPVSHLPIAAPWLYEGWLRAGLAEGRTRHGTGRRRPCDDDHPVRQRRAARGHRARPRVPPRARVTSPGTACASSTSSLAMIRRRAALVLCCSTATMDDCVRAGLDADRLRLVPLGVDVQPATAAEVQDVRADYRLPDDYLLFVGTVEPRKNLRGLVAALELLESPLPLGGGRRGRLGRHGGACVWRGPLPRLRAGAATSPRSTPARRRSATRASARATACRCWRRWPRARRWSPAAAPRRRRPRAAPPCWSTRSTRRTSPAASTTHCGDAPSCPSPVLPGRAAGAGTRARRSRQPRTAEVAR